VSANGSDYVDAVIPDVREDFVDASEVSVYGPTRVPSYSGIGTRSLATSLPSGTLTTQGVVTWVTPTVPLTPTGKGRAITFALTVPLTARG